MGKKLFALAFIILAVKTVIVAENYFFDNYNTEQGLAHNHVLSIFQDSRGLIWVGTYGGVQAFNGYEFNHFNVVGKNQAKNILSNNVVHVIFEDSRGNMWFGTENGLNKYNPFNGKLKSYFTKDGLASNNIRAICEDKKGTIWIGTYNGGVSKLDENNDITNFQVNQNQKQTLLSNLINTIYIDNADNIWIGSENGGITIFNISTEQVVHNIANLPDQKGTFTVNTFFEDEQHTMWIGTWERGLLQYDIKTNKLVQYLKQPKNNSVCGNNIKSIVQREKNSLWISTYGNGISLLNTVNEQFTSVKINDNIKEGNTQDFIWTSVIDSDKNIWFGTYGKGLFRLNTLKSTFPTYSLNYKGQKISISTIQQINSDQIWLGTMNKGLFKYNFSNKQLTEFSYNSILGSKIHSLLNANDGNLWIGKNNLYKFNRKQNNLIVYKHNDQLKNSIPNSLIDHLLQDKEGNIWCGFWEGGVYKLSKDEFNKPVDKAIFQSINELVIDSIKIVGNITHLWQDASSNIWIGTPEMVHIFNEQSKTSTSLKISVVKKIYEDNFGNYWIATNGAGLIKVNKNFQIEKTYGFNNGFDCMDIQAMEVDERGRLWMSTSCGLSMLDPKTEIISNFNHNYGFRKFSNTLNASITKQNKLVFGGGSKLCIFEAAAVFKNLKPTSAYIADIKINNKSIAYENASDSNIYFYSLMAEEDTLVLDSKNKTLTLKFASVNFEIPNDIYYAYKLEGIDDDWIIMEAHNRTATYSNLKPGTYSFKIKNSFNLGLWSNNIKTFTIHVKPEYYETLGFKLAIMVLILFIIYVFLKLLIRKNQLVLVLKQKTVFAEELSKEKEILDIKNEELQTTVDQYNNRIKALSLKYQALKENMTGLYKQLVNSKLNDASQSEQQIKQITDTIDEKITSLDSFSIGENIELDKDDFLVRFAQAYPKLSSNDLRICTLIRRNISNKDIAEQLNITSGSLEQSRYRMRKKMSLESDVNLNELILRF